jgi:Polyketide cyclase / dehydrase and lipid transport
MARYVTTIESALAPVEAFAFMADFSNAIRWDPSVVDASRSSGAGLGAGSMFDLVVVFGGRRIPMRYEIVFYDEPRVFVVEAQKASFTSRDTISVAPAEGGSKVHYDAVLEFKGFGRVLDPVMQLLFNHTGGKAATGLRAALNP